MEDIILESHLPHITPSRSQLGHHLRVSTTPHLDGRPNISSIRLKQPEAHLSRKRVRAKESIASWGRSGSGGSLLTTVGCAGILVLCPLLVIFLWNALEEFDGSLSAALSASWLEGPVAFAARVAPKFSLKACYGYAAWLSFQALLYTYLPCKISTGQLTPAGNLLKYQTNGLYAWVITHVLAGAAVTAGVLDPAILAKHWGGLIVAANIYGFLISALSYIKAILAPTHPQDRKFSGQDILFNVDVPNVNLGQDLCSMIFIWGLNLILGLGISGISNYSTMGAQESLPGR